MAPGLLVADSGWTTLLNRTRVLARQFGMELCARSIKPLEGSKPLVVGDAGSMEFEWGKRAVWACCRDGAVRRGS
jgi:hypothetical protein